MGRGAKRPKMPTTSQLMRVTFLSFVVGCAGVVLSAACDTSPTVAPPTTTSAASTAAVGGGGAGAEGGDGGVGGDGAAGGGVGAGGDAGAGGGMGIDTCGVGMPSGSGGAGGAPASGRVRVVAANLTSGNNQSYDLGHGIRILQGLDADVVLVQEMNFGSNSLAAIDSLVDDVCAGDCKYVRGPREQIPNGLLSRLPILECGSWVDPEVDNRNFVWARIDVPGDDDLWAISVHLLSSSASARALEASALLEEIAQAIPSNDLIVLGGDLNTDTRAEAAISSLSSELVTGGPYPADHDGNEMTNAPRSKPYDWVLADPDLSGRQIPVTIGLSVFPAGAVIDTRVYVPLSEIAPALVGDSGAASMQHMAVVRDFQIDP